MDDKSRANQTRETRVAYEAGRDAFRQSTSRGRDASPQSVEATLASISEEVTAEAVERRRDKDKPR